MFNIHTWSQAPLFRQIEKGLSEMNVLEYQICFGNLNKLWGVQPLQQTALNM